jgi:membrane protein
VTGGNGEASARPPLLRSLWNRIVDADLSINASAVAYNAFLALVPLGAALLGVASLFGRDRQALESISSSLAVVAPADVVAFVEDLLIEAGDRVGGGQGLLIGVSILLSLAFGSRAVAALQKALAAVENRTEARRGLQLRAVAVLLTIAAGLALLTTSMLLIVGRSGIEFLAEWTGAGWIEWTWAWLRIPVALAGLLAFLLAFYRWGPPEPLPRSWLAALVGSAGTFLASLGFGFYLAVSPNLGATFGVLGAVAVALVWLYLGTMAILLGAVVVAYVSRWTDGAPGAAAVPVRTGIHRESGRR